MLHNDCAHMKLCVWIGQAEFTPEMELLSMSGHEHYYSPESIKSCVATSALFQNKVQWIYRRAGGGISNTVSANWLSADGKV